MKKLALLLCVLCSAASYGQIELLKSFDSNVQYTGGAVLSTYGDLNYYIEVSVEECCINLYNEDFSLYKSIKLDLPEIVTGITPMYFSKKLFNGDDKIEFLVTLSYEKGGTELLLCDETGRVLQRMGSVSGYFVHRIKDGLFRLLTYAIEYDNETQSLRYSTNIYSLHGVYNATKNSFVELKQITPYPNPASTAITLPYTLRQGETAIMQIFNPQGQLVEQKQIGSMFNEILLDVSSYAKGMYVYTVNGVSNRFVVK